MKKRSEEKWPQNCLLGNFSCHDKHIVSWAEGICEISKLKTSQQSSAE